MTSVPSQRPVYHLAADAQAAAIAAAGHIAARVRERLREADRFTLALSGGSTPRLMLDALSRESLPWEGVLIVQVDERIAPEGDPARNVNMVLETLVAPGLLPAANLLAMPVTAPDPEVAAAEYARILDARAGAPPRLDLVHLGLGEDGHTASLLPGDPALEVTDRSVAVTGIYQGHRRMTLTLPLLDAARERLWLATGASKSTMLTRLMDGDPGIPAGRVSPATARVFTDVEVRARG